MKKIWVYLLGVLTGIVITIVALFIIGLAINSNAEGNTTISTLAGTTFFEESGDVIEPSSIQVFQALSSGYALANCKGDSKSDIYLDQTVLLYDAEGTPFYDDQIVNAPKGKCFRQVGIYKYESKMGRKTVPIVMLLDK